MAQLPDNVEDTVLHVKTGATGLPFGYIKIGGLWAGRQRGCGANLLVHRSENPIVDLQAKGVQAGLLLEQRRRR